MPGEGVGVGVGIIIFNEKGEILLILRNKDKDKAKSDMRLEGTWTLPAGKVKLGESLIDSAKRIALKEVNLNVDNISVISVADDINEYAHFLTIGVVSRMWSGEISLGDTEEHVDYGFFDLDNLPVTLCVPSKKIIRNYLSKKIYMEEK